MSLSDFPKVYSRPPMEDEFFTADEDMGIVNDSSTSKKAATFGAIKVAAHAKFLGKTLLPFLPQSLEKFPHSNVYANMKKLGALINEAEHALYNLGFYDRLNEEGLERFHTLIINLDKVGDMINKNKRVLDLYNCPRCSEAELNKFFTEAKDILNNL